MMSIAQAGSCTPLSPPPHCSFSERTARLYMQTANGFRELDAAKRQSIAVLPLNRAMEVIAGGKEKARADECRGKVRDGIRRTLELWTEADQLLRRIESEELWRGMGFASFAQFCREDDIDLRSIRETKRAGVCAFR